MLLRLALLFLGLHKALWQIPPGSFSSLWAVSTESAVSRVSRTHKIIQLLTSIHAVNGGCAVVDSGNRRIFVIDSGVFIEYSYLRNPRPQRPSRSTAPAPAFYPPNQIHRLDQEVSVKNLHALKILMCQLVAQIASYCVNPAVCLTCQSPFVPKSLGSADCAIPSRQLLSSPAHLVAQVVLFISQLFLIVQQDAE